MSAIVCSPRAKYLLQFSIFGNIVVFDTPAWSARIAGRQLLRYQRFLSIVAARRSAEAEELRKNAVGLVTQMLNSAKDALDLR
jgi:hypothetical protein